MTSDPPRRSLRRPAVTGFATGFALAFVVTALALVMPIAEVAHPVLVPAAALLAPVAERMSAWNGLLNMVIAGTVNGLVYAAAFAAVALLSGRGRPSTASRTGSPPARGA